MNNLYDACSSAILWSSSLFVMKSPIGRFYASSWKKSFQHAGVRTANSELLLTRFWVQRYSSKRSRKRNLDPKTVMKDDKESFFVVRKGDLVGVYKNLSDCQAQVGSSICDPPVSVYKGCSMPKDTEKYLLSCGIRNALYSIRASDLTGDIFGTLVPCPFPQHPSARGEPSGETMTKKWSQEVAWSDYGQRTCTLEFDGASKGNPGQAGAGAVIRSNDGSMICRLREGLGIATNNAAEYRGIILGLKYALGKGFTGIQVRGDSNLVCMQIQGLWKVKNQNISGLYEEAKKLKDRFISFEINHVLRDLNSEADAQANLAVDLAEGQIQEEIDK
ncbi:uncharacterized protein LOC111376229 isoform X1 [Olea europaea subsp. europaea]|uniref:Uncharacterized protein LOC111376229 isoform X1 n=2 Tax=Olea europaea subsp. europaea TaxID=158383 RepID=A0A8S0UWQ0_OLEEU|nr:uncharacterized protein LOC111376229 isoform X1 [Olea europaea subsp. europaea]